MEKTKEKLIATTIMLVVILLMCCCAFVPEIAHAETMQNNIEALNLENSNESIDYQNIKTEKGIIADLQTVKNNVDTFKQYLHDTDGNVLIPNRDDSNILAYQIIDIDDTNINLYPIYLYNNVEKDKIDYQEVFNETVSLTSSVTDGDAYDFMSATAIFFVYSKNYLNKYLHIATVNVKLTVDYYPTTDATYDYYVGKYEVLVSPKSKWYFKSFDMCLMQSEDYYMDTSKYQTNNSNTLETYGFTFETGITGAIGANGVQIGGNLKIGMNYSFSANKGKVSVNYNTFYVKDGFKYDSYHVSPSSRSSKGLAYSGLIYYTYRMMKTQEKGALGITFRKLDIKGQIAEPSFDIENGDSCVIIAVWDKSFSNKSMMILQGVETGSSDKSHQYFDDLSTYSSLPNKHSAGFSINYTEN